MTSFSAIKFYECVLLPFPPLQVYERSYLRTQREEYLKQQLALEKKASEIVFHTINITNALSPDEYFEKISRPTIQDTFAKDPFGELPFYWCELSSVSK